MGPAERLRRAIDQLIGEERPALFAEEAPRPLGNPHPIAERPRPTASAAPAAGKRIASS